MSRDDGARPPEILLVEDSPSDARLVREAFRERMAQHHLHLARDGEAALEHLKQEEPSQRPPRPDLVLLDLNLPKKDGRQVLAELKADQSLKTIPVCVLTTSADPADVTAAYRLGANCYVVKQMDMDGFIGQMKAIYDFWFQTVKLPEE